MRDPQRKIILATGLALLASSASLIAQTTVKTIVSNGNSSNRYDIVILGDGYKSTEQAKFNSNCLAVTNKLFATPPYSVFKMFFNVHTVFRASKESGADHPDKTPPIVKDTVYNASYNVGGTARCLYIKNSSQALKDAALAPAVEGRVMVIVNDSRYGGCAGTFAVTYNGGSMSTVQVHEFGHSFGLLADEYDYPNGTYSGGEPSRVNVTKDSTGKAKWPLWVGSNGVAAYEGAMYYKKGIYRPKSSCIMRSLGAAVCPVCAEQVVKQSYKTTNPIEKPLPTASLVTVNAGTKQTFSFTNLVPANNAVIVWTVGGKLQTSIGTSLVVDTSGMSGNHAVSVSVRDKTTYVRSDPAKLLQNVRNWTLRVIGQPFVDLNPIYLTADSATIVAGGSADLVSVTQNSGNVKSPTFQVEVFLSSDKTIGPNQDPLLGATTHVALDPFGGAKIVNFKGVVIPAHVRPGNYYLGLISDRGGKVNESNESNNIYWTAITVTKPGCQPQLSYNTPLSFPPVQGSIAGKTGGLLRPVFTAPCDAGQNYLILLGCSGTSPGTVMAPGVTIPLNADLCTSLFYPLARSNAGMVVGFYGTLDASGYGYATLAVPPNVVTGTLKGHFAGLVINKTTRAFTRATNAVTFEMK